MTEQSFKRILVPTDFGEPAAHARDVAITIARRFDARLILLHVYHIPTPAYDVGVVWPIEGLEDRAQEALDAELANVRQQYTNCEGALRGGYPSERIVEIAKQSGVDLIVMGTHGRRGLPRVLLGSVAEKVLRTSPVPVLTVAAAEPALASSNAVR